MHQLCIFAASLMVAGPIEVGQSEHGSESDTKAVSIWDLADSSSHWCPFFPSMATRKKIHDAVVHSRPIATHQSWIHVDPMGRIKISNAAYPIPSSTELRQKRRRFLGVWGLQDRTLVHIYDEHIFSGCLLFKSCEKFCRLAFLSRTCIFCVHEIIRGFFGGIWCISITDSNVLISGDMCLHYRRMNAAEA